jgi:hypothetical protein
MASLSTGTPVTRKIRLVQRNQERPDVMRSIGLDEKFKEVAESGPDSHEAVFKLLDRRH